jgi:endonuclease III
MYLTSQAHFASSFHHTIGILTGFMNKGWESAELLSAASVVEVDSVLSDFESNQKRNLEVAETLLTVAAEIQNNHGGVVPQTKEALKSIGLEEPLVSLLMQQAYAQSELVISLDTRKVLVALDMVDWEEFGAKSKSEVKMGKVTPQKVRRSLRTWLPKGEGVHFHDTMDSIGSLISARNVGGWGKIEKVISSHFSTKDKDALSGIIQAICQFSKATRSKRGKKQKVIEDEE